MRFQEHRSWGDLPFVQSCFDRPEFGTLPTLSPRFPFRGYRWPVVLSIVVGGLWALPFLFPSTAGIAWFIPGIVFLTAGSSTRLSPFQMGYLTGLYFHLTGLYWLLFMPVRVGALLGWVCLSAYCALFPAIWAFFVWRMLPSISRQQNAGTNRTAGLARLAQLTWIQRQLWALVGASGWVSIEMLQAHLLTGFPWNFLGTSQVDLLPLIQLASVTGVYGVSFLIAWVSLSLLLAMSRLIEHPGHPFSWSRELALAGGSLILVTGLGFLRIQSATLPDRILRIALIQPSVSQREIWEGTRAEERLSDLLELSTSALSHQPDLMVWPESALPSSIPFSERVPAFIAEHQIPLIFNEVDLRPSDPAGTRSNQYFNAAFAMNRSGIILDVAHKHQLVMFGEYMPLANRFPILRAFSPIGIDFSQGKKPGILELPELSLTLGSLICFEDAFPRLARATAQVGPDFLINLTNDAWFGESMAHWQHARGAIFRAIETGLPLVRAANNGISCWIDPYGRLGLGKIDQPNDVYKRGYKIVQIPIPEPTLHPRTIYLRDGNVFGWLCVSANLALLFLRELFRFRGSNHDSNFDIDLLRDPV